MPSRDDYDWLPLQEGDMEELPAHEGELSYLAGLIEKDLEEHFGGVDEARLMAAKHSDDDDRQELLDALFNVILLYDTITSKTDVELDINPAKDV